MPSEVDSQGSELDGYYQLASFEACFHGEWKDNKPHGQGIAIFPNGTLLVGMFRNGSCEGSKNYLIYGDGSYYAGSMAGNKIEGRGKLVSPNVTYEGGWSGNLPHGDGVEQFANGDRYIGNFERGVKQGNDCLFIWNNHEHYLQFKGSFREGRIEG